MVFCDSELRKIGRNPWSRIGEIGVCSADEINGSLYMNELGILVDSEFLTSFVLTSVLRARVSHIRRASAIEHKRLVTIGSDQGFLSLQD